ncbi:hypothetical protein BBH88_18255 [Planococcus antarcticus DSM 14505]|uniref:Uncharacterized protein n=1 Tax=Planococcus antarcticus DSM 14505 TaxID=1185653 RepID=A0ABM6D9I3_9BACL|nr:DUF6544 family protein [Planococcus antarcticus]ANU12061.1 hypothetical protein BBH88_18255 [Planococcus antarcticus DSM 14505]
MKKKAAPGAKSNRAITKRMTAEMTESLPLPVKNWLHAIGAVGHEQINNVSLKQSGWIKLKPEQKAWTASEAKQISFTDPPAFRWSVKMKMGKGLFVTGKDSFEEGKASMRIKIAGILPISKSVDNEKTNQSALQRYLMEMAWYPSAVFSPLLSWERVDAHTAKATITYRELTGSATYFFNEQSELLRVEAWRYKDSGKDALPLLCIGTVIEQQLVDGLTVPVKMEVSWVLEGGTFTWYKFDAQDIRFNAINERIF